VYIEWRGCIGSLQLTYDVGKAAWNGGRAERSHKILQSLMKVVTITTR
jgi:hypothetical protein